MKKIKTIHDIPGWRLCLGCGACAYICPENKITLEDVIDDGIRPKIDSNNCVDCRECVDVCPGYKYEDFRSEVLPASKIIPELKEGWGPVLELWEGYAIDSDIRYNGSSAGLANALAMYCLEKENMSGVLHTGANPKKPWKNMTVFSQNRSELLSRTGSRYSPASPCDGLDKMESASEQCVFIGKPCDVAGLRKAQLLKAALDKKVGVAIGIFCAGTPSTLGTLELFKRLNIKSDDVEEVRYRGRGWPGMFTVRLRGDNAPSHKMSYMESWGFLQKYRPFRCYLCPDGTSEFADISCGDPWYRELKGDEVGDSLVLVRTKKGLKILHGAIKAGYVKLKMVDYSILEKSQNNLLLKRKAIWGRLLAMKLFFIPTPKLNGFSLFGNWRDLTLKEKMRSFLGTIRRIVQRKYYKPKKPTQ